ncbi:MAG: carbon-nitrogen hydrolase family protein [Actinomycetales bacterium]|nr:carbon-nitrogen hydrolase family protein [Actinomycetales bacterium]
MTVGQLDVGADRSANLAVAERLLELAAQEGAALAVLPEYASSYESSGVGIEHAEPLDGPWVTGLRAAAARHGVAVVAGVIVPDASGERAQNVVVAIDAAGELRGTYAKVHLYDAFGYRESDRLAPGDPAAEPLVLDVAGVRFGVITCYDLRFPESARRLVDAGAEAILVPAAWVDGPGKAAQWRALAVARAIENTAWVIAVGQAGAARTGRSVVIDPEGVVRAELGVEPATATVTVDPAVVGAVRERNPALALRRYEVTPR